MTEVNVEDYEATEEEIIEDDDQATWTIGDEMREEGTYRAPAPGAPNPDDFLDSQWDQYESQLRGFNEQVGRERAKPEVIPPELELYQGLGPSDKRQVTKIAELQTEIGQWDMKAASASVRPGGSQEAQEHQQRAQRARDELAELTAQGFRMDKLARKHHSASVGQDILGASMADGPVFKPAIQAIEAAIDDFNSTSRDNTRFALITRNSGYQSEYAPSLTPRGDGRDIAEVNFSSRPELLGMMGDIRGDDLIDFALSRGLPVTRVSADSKKWGKPAAKKASEDSTVKSQEKEKLTSPITMVGNRAIFGGGK